LLVLELAADGAFEATFVDDRRGQRISGARPL